MIFAGTPPATVMGGTSFVTTAPAAMMAEFRIYFMVKRCQYHVVANQSAVTMVMPP